jgi:hypothetical protein
MAPMLRNLILCELVNLWFVPMYKKLHLFVSFVKTVKARLCCFLVAPKGIWAMCSTVI